MFMDACLDWVGIIVVSMITKNQTMMKRCGKVYIEMIGLRQPFFRDAGKFILIVILIYCLV